MKKLEVNNLLPHLWRAEKIAKNTEEACKLVETGFDFVCSTPDELIVFRKRK
jgi:hypothetical protein